jgi:hypothetical protein
MAGRYAAKTEVPVSRTRDEIERTLSRYGAEAFSYGWDGDRAVVMFQAEGRRIRFDVVVPGDLTESRRAQVERQRWRALLLVIKAKLEAVAVGIVTFEEEFLAHIMLPDGSKVAEWMAPQLKQVYESGQMPELLPPARAALKSGGRR